MRKHALTAALMLIAPAATLAVSAGQSSEGLGDPWLEWERQLQPNLVARAEAMESDVATRTMAPPPDESRPKVPPSIDALPEQPGTWLRFRVAEDLPATSMFSPSFALDSLDRPHFLFNYFNTRVDDFVHAAYSWFDGINWHTTPFDCNLAPGFRDRGLAVDYLNRPHVVLLTQDACPGKTPALTYGILDDGVWNFETIAPVLSGSCSPQIGLLKGDTPYVFTSDCGGTFNNPFSYLAIRNDTGWQIHKMDRFFYDFSTAVGSDGVLHATWESRDGPFLRDGRGKGFVYATWNGTAWAKEFVEGCDREFGLAISPVDNTPHVSCNWFYYGLEYFRKDENGWHLEFVDRGRFPYFRVGIDTSIDVDAHGRPHIVHRYFQITFLSRAVWPESIHYVVKLGAGDVWYDEQLSPNRCAFCVDPAIVLDSQGVPRVAYEDVYGYTNWDGSLTENPNWLDNDRLVFTTPTVTRGILLGDSVP